MTRWTQEDNRHNRYENIKQTKSIIINGKRMGVFDLWECRACGRKFRGRKNLREHKDKEHRY